MERGEGAIRTLSTKKLFSGDWLPSQGAPAGTRAITRAATRLLPRHAGRCGQRIHVGIVHAGRTLTVEAADSTWRIHDDNGVVAEVARTATKPVTRFKVHKP